VLGAATAFGVVSVLARRAYELGSSPVALLGARMLVASLVLTPVAVRVHRSSIRARELMTGAAAGLAFAGAGLGEFEALARAPAPTVVLIVFVAPVWVALADWASGEGPPGWLPACGVVLMLVGLALLLGVPGGGGTDPTAVGLALAGSVMSAAFFIAMARLAERLAPLGGACIAAWAAAVATLALRPTGVASELSSAATAPYGLAIGCLTACGLGLLAAGLRAGSALWASALIGVEPLVSAGLSWALLGEFLDGTQLAGAASVVLGVTTMSVLTGPEPRGPSATGRTRLRPRGSRRPRRPARSARRRR
jgi:drug/metabolite transporter (DMT)-like permease